MINTASTGVSSLRVSDVVTQYCQPTICERVKLAVSDCATACAVTSPHRGVQPYASVRDLLCKTARKRHNTNWLVHTMSMLALRRHYSSIDNYELTMRARMRDAVVMLHSHVPTCS